MQDLRLVAANERGTHLVLRSPDGEKFVVSIDERLRAAIRGDKTLLSQLDVGDGQLRPRDIQAKIRAGASAEQVARDAGVHVDRVRRFEGPVLAEREHMAQMAQRAAVRRPGQADARPATLGDVLAPRLAQIDLTVGEMDWDSWRRDDGRWVVQGAYDHDDDAQLAKFVFDPRARSVVAENEQARWLTGELEQHPQRGPFVPRFAPAPAPAALLQESTDDADLDDTDDADILAALGRPDDKAVEAPAPARRPDPTLNRRAPDVVARRPEPAPAPIAAPRPATVVAPPTPAPAVLPPVPSVPLVVPAARVDTPAPKPAPQPAPAAPPARPEVPAARHQAPAPKSAPKPAPPAEPTRRTFDAPTLPMDAEEVEEVQAQRTGTNDSRGDVGPAPAPPARARGRRASVPSWDDILIGTRPRD